MLQEAACRLVKSAGDDSILDQILSDGVKATRKCKGKKAGIGKNKGGDICTKTSTSGKQVLTLFLWLCSYINLIVRHIMHCIFLTEVGMSQDSGGQFREVINAFLEPKCHLPDSENVRR